MLRLWYGVSLYWLLHSYGNGQWHNWQWQTMYIIRLPFWSTWRCAGAIRSAVPTVACPGLLRKPLDTAIGHLPTLYRPSGRKGNNQQIDDAKYPPFACHFDGRGRRFMNFLKTTKHHHRASTCSNITQSDVPNYFGGIFHRQIDNKGLELTFKPQLTRIGVWHIKMMRSL